MPKPWRRLRVVVEVPVMGDFNEKDLRWVVNNALQFAPFWPYIKHLPDEKRPTLGRLQVKQFNRVMAKEPKP